MVHLIAIIHFQCSPGVWADPNPQVPNDPLSCWCYRRWYEASFYNQLRNHKYLYRALRGILWALGVRVETKDPLSPQVRPTSSRECLLIIFFHGRTLPVCHNVSKPICVEEWKTDYTTGQRVGFDYFRILNPFPRRNCGICICRVWSISIPFPVQSGDRQLRARLLGGVWGPD